jgi:hypothetical protein
VSAVNRGSRAARGGRRATRNREVSPLIVFPTAVQRSTLLPTRS